MNKPLWMWLGWAIALLCVVGMILESTRATLPSSQPGCLWFCAAPSPDAITCVQHCPEARARAPPGRR